MIGEITDNIVYALSKFGFRAKDDVQELRDIITTELSKYEISRRETALVVHDRTDFDIIARFFLAKTTAGLSEKSLTYYKHVLQMALPRLGKKLNDVTADDIRAYLTIRRVNGISNITLDNERRILSTFFEFSYEEGSIDHNPMRRVERVRTQKIQKKPFTEDEMERLRLAARTERNRAIVEFFFSTACRVSEVAALNRADIDFDTREVIVLGKGNKERKVFLSPRCVSTLKTYLGSRKDDHPALFISEACVGKHHEIGRLSTSAYEIIIRKAGKKAGIEKAHPHRIRRTSATIALHRGMPIEQVSKMLGHEDLKTTTIYASSTMDEVKESHDKYII